MNSATVYMLGKVSDLPYQEVADKFNYWHKMLNDLGYIVYNPTVFIPQHTDWHKAMETCLSILHKSDKALPLPDWPQSNGACIEMELIIKQNKPLLSRGFVLQQWSNTYKHYKIA